MYACHAEYGQISRRHEMAMPMKEPTNPLTADPQHSIDLTSSFDTTYFSTLLQITPECLHAAVKAAGPKLSDVRHYLEGPGAETKVERPAPPNADNPLLTRSELSKFVSHSSIS
jgi:hypothetical protein